MEKLLRIYNEHIDSNETYYLLGISHQKGIENYDDSKLIECFLYTYSNLGLSACEILSIENLKTRLYNDLQKLSNQMLTTPEKWWCLCLIYLKIGAEYYNLSFFRTTIETLLDKSSTLSLAELGRYCNIINDTLSNAIGFDLRIRPSADNNKSVYISKVYLSLTSKSKEIIDILKTNLSLDELTNIEVSKEHQLLNQIGFDYNPWTTVFDIFVGQILVTLDSPISKMNDTDNYLNVVEIALLNLSSEAKIIPANLQIASEKISKFLK